MPSSTFWGMQHLNSNVLASVVLDSTREDPEQAEPYQLCILPLDQDLQPHSDFPLFNMTFQVESVEGLKRMWGRVSIGQVSKSNLSAFDKDKVAFLLMHWFLNDMKLNRFKKIVPLAHKWPETRDMLIRWLGWETFSEIFSEDYRDTHVAANYLNDRLAVRGEPVPYAKQTLSWLAKQLYVDRPTTDGSPTEDCMTLGQVYKRLLQA
jgi:hypothetical protein